MNQHNVDPNNGAVILAGGRSQRMRQDKASLPFGGQEVMLQRIVRLVGEVVPPEATVVVAAAGQPLPPLPGGVTVARDEHPDCGPMEGLRVGMAAMPSGVDGALMTSCDAPLLVPGVLRCLLQLSGSKFDALPRTGTVDRPLVIPRDVRRPHPLCAVYPVSLLPTIEELIAQSTFKMMALIERAQLCITVSVEQFRPLDPELLTFRNCNTPEEYEAALRLAGLGDC